MSDEGTEQTNLTAAERAVVKRIAERDGITEEQAATNLAKAWLENRVRRRTGKAPARVYELRRK